jgi:hypothetical protein
MHELIAARESGDGISPFYPIMKRTTYCLRLMIYALQNTDFFLKNVMPLFCAGESP